jgi:hypothetical protein
VQPYVVGDDGFTYFADGRVEAHNYSAAVRRCPELERLIALLEREHE